MKCEFCGKAVENLIKHKNQFHETMMAYEEGNPNHDPDSGKFTSGSGGGGAHAGKTEKDLIKQIKGGSDNWKDWYRNETNEELYKEIERRNREIPFPQKPEGVGATIFRDDPDAVKKMENKIKYLEDVQDYWKKIIKFPARDYHTKPHQLGDAKWYELTGAGANLRDAKKKLEQIKAQQASGTQLVRKPTYKDGKKRFYYEEQPTTESFANEDWDEIEKETGKLDGKGRLDWIDNRINQLSKQSPYTYEEWKKSQAEEFKPDIQGKQIKLKDGSITTIQSVGIFSDDIITADNKMVKDGDYEIIGEVEFVKPTLWHCEDCDTDLGDGKSAGKHQDETGHHNIAKKRVGEVGESWDDKTHEERWTRFEKIGFKANEAIVMANLTWADLSLPIRAKLCEVEDSDKEEKRDDSFDSFNNAGEQPDTTTGQNIDYNKTFESTTLRTKYECEHCNAGFKSTESLMTHFNDTHAKTTDGEGCLYCNENISPENMVEHLAYEHAFIKEAELESDNLEGARHQMHNDIKHLNNQDVKHGGFDWQEGHEVKETCSQCFGSGKSDKHNPITGDTCNNCKGTGQIDPDHMGDPFSTEADDSEEEAKNKIEDYYKHSFTGMIPDKIKDWEEKQSASRESTANERSQYWRNTFDNPYGYDGYLRCKVCGADVDSLNDDGTRMTDAKLLAHYDEHDRKGEIPHFGEAIAKEDYESDSVNSWQEASATGDIPEDDKTQYDPSNEAISGKVIGDYMDIGFTWWRCRICKQTEDNHGDAIEEMVKHLQDTHGIERSTYGEAIAVEDDLDDDMMKKPKSERTVTMTAKQFRDSLKENFTGKCPECKTYVEDTPDDFCLNCGASFDENDNVSEAEEYTNEDADRDQWISDNYNTPANQIQSTHARMPNGLDDYDERVSSPVRNGLVGNNESYDEVDMNTPEGRDVVNDINKHASRGGKWQRLREPWEMEREGNPDVGEAKPKMTTLSSAIDRINKKHEPEGGWSEDDYVGEGEYEPSSSFFDADIEQRNDGYHVVQDLPTDKRSHDVESFDPMNPNAGEAWANEGWFECQDCKFFSTNPEDADKHKETGHDVGSFGFSSVTPYSKSNPV